MSDLPFVHPEFEDEMSTAVNWPAVVTWNRLEARPRAAEFRRSLRSEVRDPLWMLTRQWQIGEFRGEDAGSAIETRVLVESRPINRFAPGAEPAEAYGAVPLEAMAEAEPVPLDLGMRILAGRHWRRMLLAAVPNDPPLDAYLGRYGFSEPANPVERELFDSDVRARSLLAAARGRIVDGGALLAEIPSGAHDDFVDAEIDAAIRTVVRETATAFASWFRRIFHQPDELRGSWSPSDLEYRFRCAAPDADPTRGVVVADEYHHGTLDWTAFDMAASNDPVLLDRPDETIEDPPPRDDLLTFVPAPVQFPGMPAPRWWEMEDRRVDFSGFEASTTDLPRLLLAEAALIYANDWSLVPLPLDVGTLARVRGVVVLDVFGRRTWVERAETRDEGGFQHWSMYGLSQRGDDASGDALLLPPTVAKVQEGAPLERVQLLRDEMANMVWAVEDWIPGLVGDGVDGHEAAADLWRLLEERHGVGVTGAGVEPAAPIRYELGSSVPANWIPLIPAHVPGSDRRIELVRAAMENPFPGSASETTAPRGCVLRPPLVGGDGRYRIREREVSRAGAIVTRSFQRARTADGGVVCWIGRRKSTGHGPGASGLRFDQVRPTTTASE